MRLLLVEDDSMIGENVRLGLRKDGFAVDWIRDGETARTVMSNETYDAILLDLGLPRIDGLDLLRYLRSMTGPRGRVPVLVITARDAVPDRVTGLDAGADDYLPKPFALDELFARIRALLRRVGPGPAAGPDDVSAEHLVLDDLCLDPAGRRVTRGGVELELSKTEFDLLELFLRNVGIVLDHSTIYDRIWHYDFGPDSKNLAVYVGYLRRKTEAGGGRRLIHTVRGVGYVARVVDA